MKIKNYFTVVAGCAILWATAAGVVDAQTQTDTQSTTANLKQSSNLSAQDVQRFSAAVQVIKKYYVEPVPDQKLFENAIRGMMEGLDPHSNFLDADDLRDLKDATTGEFSGLGIEITMENGLIKVISPLDGSPAQKAGIKPGDLIVLIDNTPVKGMTIRDAVKKMRGKKGSSVTLAIVRKDEPKPIKLKLVRDDIKVPSVKGKMLEDGYGYIRIGSFQTTTAAMLEKTVNDLKAQSKGELKGIVLDLRNDPGGLLDSAIKVSDDFIDAPAKNGNDLIVYTKGRINGTETKVNATPGDILNGAPMVVLINEGSASGSEIVAGALQDHKRALIVGTKSFGKGSVQTVIPLDSTSAIKLTTALYYTPSGRSIQAEGINPDVVVPELKVTTADKAEDNIDAVKEANLTGHLLNAKATKTTTTTTTPGSSSTTVPDKNTVVLPAGTDLSTTDFQLFEALNILKGLVVTGQH